MNLFFNSIVFIDLYLTLKHPFYPRESRAKYYWASGFVIIFLFMISYNIFDPKGPGFNYKQRWIYEYIGLFLTLSTILVTFLIVSRLRIEGTSRDLKSKVLKRHLAYFGLYILCLF